MVPMTSLLPSDGSRRHLAAFVASLAVAAAWLLGAATAHAQIELDVTLARHAYILYEPIIATITVTNNTGHEVTFEDTGAKQWFNLDVTRLDGGIVQPYDADYKLRPLTVHAGETLRRQIDLTPLFPIREMGTHRIRANIYYNEADKFFYSNYVTFELTDGKLLWRQNVGSPTDIGSTRQVSLLTHTLLDKMLLYVRVRDEDGNTVYTTQSLGRVITSGREPQEFFDRNNVLHVLHESFPGSYLYTEINMDGERLNQVAYLRVGASRPTLFKTPAGNVEVRGGQLQEPRQAGEQARTPKLSDRPAGLPNSPGEKYQNKGGL